MRLFYDQYAAPRRAGALLLLADCVSIVTAVLFTTGAAYFGRGPLDAALLSLWALIPRYFAKFLAWLGRPRDFVVSVLLSTAFVVFTMVLLLAGWEILAGILPLHWPLRLGTSLIVVFTWAAGFLLGQPRAYRLHDFLLVSLVLLGLLQRMPHALFWVTLFIASLLLSAASRHLVHDIFPGTRKPPLNLQNVRMLAFGATTIAVAIFAAVWLPLRPVIDSRSGPKPLHRGAFLWNSLGSSSEDDIDWSGDGLLADRPRASRTESSIDARAERPKDDARTIGFTHKVRLRDLSVPREDQRVVLIARALNRDLLAGRPDGSAGLGGTTLWKALSFSSFDPLSASWLETAPSETLPWPEEDRVEIASAENAHSRQLDPERTVEILVTLPVFRNFVGPSCATAWSTVRAGSAAAQVDARPTSYRRSLFDDMVPLPYLRRGSHYQAHFRPLRAVRRLAQRFRDAGLHPEARYREVPAADQVGIDLHEFARRHLGRGRSAGDKIERLQRLYGRAFQATNRTTWTGSGRRLEAFLERERRGDCTYFSTATALVLRAAGVSTRLAVGFYGGDRRRDGSVVVRNSTAHAWVEVWQENSGWLPINPIAWADIDPEVATESAATEVTEDGQGGELNRRPVPGPSDDAEDDVLDPEDDPLARLEGETWHAPDFDTGLPGGEAGGDETGDEEAAIESWVTTDASGDGATEETAEAPEEETAAAASTPDSALGLRSLMLRIALVLLAIAAAGLTLYAYFRPRRRELEADEEEAEVELDALGDPRVTRPDWRPQTPGEQVLWDYHRLQLDLRRTRRHRRASETPIEHARQHEGVHADLGGAFRRIHRVLYSVLYGRRTPKDAHVRDARESAQIIRRHLS